MSLTEEQRSGLGIALNEADLLGFHVHPGRRIARATFRVLTLPESGPPPEDRRVHFIFRPVGRVAASLRNGRWDDPNAEIIPFGIHELLETVQSFGELSIYGWEFIDVHAKQLAQWGDRLSLDWSSGQDGLSHSIAVFQDPGERILDLCVWFDSMELRDPQGRSIPLDSFIAGGKRWWEAFNAGDKRTTGYGMFPMKGPAVTVGSVPEMAPRIDTPLGVLRIRADCQLDCRFGVAVAPVSPQLPPGMEIAGCVAALWWLEAESDTSFVFVRCIWDIIPGMPDAESGELLEAQSWIQKGFVVTVGTEDSETLAQRASLAPHSPQRLIDASKESPAVFYHPDGLWISFPRLRAGDRCEGHFVVAWMPEGGPQASTWFAVAWPHERVRAALGNAEPFSDSSTRSRE
jgi:hypothetical protein